MGEPQSSNVIIKPKRYSRRGAIRKTEPRQRRKHKQGKSTENRTSEIGSFRKKEEKGDRPAARSRKLSRSFQACPRLSTPLLGVSSSWGTQIP